MKWLVEEYDTHVIELVNEIRKQGHECDFIKYYDMIKDPNYTGTGLPKNKGTYPGDECVLFYGSIQLAGWLMKYKTWVPTVWYDKDKYKVSHWSPKLQRHMLNYDYIMLPKGMITHRYKDLFEGYACKDLFMRPDNGTKSFGGKVFALETFEKDWDRATHLMDDHEIVLISEPYKITKEWRFIVDHNEIISGSQYKVNGSAEIEPGYPQAAYDKCMEVIKEQYNPDPLYTIDIGLCPNDLVHKDKPADVYYLIEINNFCCSGLYACDLSKIVKRASELAIQEHKEYYSQ